jgi:two-component system chemotaxis response regulator CheY
MPIVMVADDAQFFRIRLGKLLAEHGYAVVEAADGVEAVDVYRATQPDAVLMDLTMPNKDGMTALTEICQLDPCARVIMLTALGQQSIMLQAARAGAREFLVKPCEPARVVGAVRRVLEQAL